MKISGCFTGFMKNRIRVQNNDHDNDHDNDDQ